MDVEIIRRLLANGPRSMNGLISSTRWKKTRVFAALKILPTTMKKNGRRVLYVLGREDEKTWSR